jgi:hypothetical protein
MARPAVVRQIPDPRNEFAVHNSTGVDSVGHLRAMSSSWSWACRGRYRFSIGPENHELLCEDVSNVDTRTPMTLLASFQLFM